MALDATSADAIVTRGLTKIYKGHIGRARVHSLDSLDLTIRENEVFGFLGRNGAGKTTTIKLLCSLMRPTRGEAYILGRMARKREARAHVGYLPENPYFYEYLTPRETLDFYGRLNGLSAAARASEWKRLSEIFELGAIAEQRVRTFSKGMRQRLGFAVAMVGNPPILILDEPMSGLDPLGRRHMRELILRLRDEKKTIFFSSHVLSDVEQICDRVGILVKGKLTSQGRIDELLTQRVKVVEVLIAVLDESAIAEVAAKAISRRRSEEGIHLVLPDVETANEVVRFAQSRGGRLVDFTSIRESLEDHFVSVQDLGR